MTTFSVTIPKNDNQFTKVNIFNKIRESAYCDADVSVDGRTATFTFNRALDASEGKTAVIELLKKTWPGVN